MGFRALPGAVHDLAAARIWSIVRDLAASGLVVLGGKWYHGEHYVRTPHKGRNKPAAQKDANRAHAKLRSPGERANAQLIPEGEARWIAEGDVLAVAFNTAATVAGDTTGQVHALQLNVPAAASA